MDKMTQVFNKVNAVRGMNDALPGFADKLNQFETIVRDWLKMYGYRNMRTPVLEHTRLFARGIGEVTDIVEKEMYTFKDPLNDESLTMRPEFTAGVVRAVIEHNLLYDRAQRIYTMGPVFRHERPQRGRYRQFHQVSIEALGMPGPDVDAELIIMTNRLWRMLGITGMRLEMNSLGQSDERAAHRVALIAHLEKFKDILDEDGLRRMYSNPLRVLDTKNPALQEMAEAAPRLSDFLGTESKQHLDGVLCRLDDAGIEYVLNPRMVRGIDYYNLTVFEWITDKLGAQATVCGGGRYDGLIELLGGKAAPAVGCGIGIERLVDLWVQATDPAEPAECQVYLLHQGDDAQRCAAKLAEEIRDQGISVVVHPGSASFRSQFKRADSSGASIAVILAGDELASGVASVKMLRLDPNQGELGQQTVALDRLAPFLKDKV